MYQAEVLEKIEATFLPKIMTFMR